MTIDQMRYFLEAAKFEHVGRAAKSVAISPSAISAAISALEDKFGYALFDKRGKNIQLNAQGRILKARVEKILDELSSLESDLKHESTSLEGTYRLSGSPFLASALLHPAWLSVQKKNPKLVGDLSSMHTAIVIEQLIAGTLDFALCFSPYSHPDLKIEEIHQGQLRLAVRKNHPILKKKGPISRLSDFPTNHHKAMPGVALCEKHPMFEKFGITPNAISFYDSDEFAIQNMLVSDSWSLMPEIVITANEGKIVAVPHPREWDAPYTIAAITRQHRNNKVLKELLLATILGLREMQTNR